MNPEHVAHVIGKLSAGGVEAVMYNYYRFIDHTKYQFDFIIDADSSCEPLQELIDMGAKYYVVHPYQQLPLYLRDLERIFKENHYRIVHSSMNTLAVFSLYAAWRVGVPVRICHSHSTAAKGETKKNVFKYLLRPFSKTFVTNLCACSQLAGKWLFGEKTFSEGTVTVFNNAIDLTKFSFKPEVREETRKELAIPDDCLLIGHIGRFCFQKNQEFLIKIFCEVLKEKPCAKLLLVGIGPDMERIRNLVKAHGVGNKVIFLGARNDVNRIYQAIDVFILPSRYEGLPVVLIEAQAAGLPCIVSDAVTDEACQTENFCWKSLRDTPSEWAKLVCELADHKNKREGALLDKFDIRKQAKVLEMYYDRALYNEL